MSKSLKINYFLFFVCLFFFVASNGDFKSGVKGAVAASMFASIDGYYGKSWGYERVAANAVAGGATAKIYGTSVSDGVKFAGLTAAARWGYSSSVGFDANPLPGENGEETTYLKNSDGRQPPSAIRQNVVGYNEELTGHFWSDIGKQGGGLSKSLNVIPGINATAALHDYWFNMPDAIDQTLMNNIGTMVPAALISYSAIMGGATLTQVSASRK